MNAFSPDLWYSRSTDGLQRSFFDGFSRFLSQCVSEHSQTQFCQPYWVVKGTARLVSHTGMKNHIPKLENTSSYKLESFSPTFWKFQNFLQNAEVARTKTGNVGSGSKVTTQSHERPGILQ